MTTSNHRKLILQREPLGTGSFGTVYQGRWQSSRHGKAPKDVAVKIEPADCASPSLKQEYKFYQQLKGGEGIPSIYCLSELKDGSFALVMDLLGKSLEDLLDLCNRRFSLACVCTLAEQMISRVEWCHSKGIVIRDIKPDNFLMGRSQTDTASTVFLVDFGLAKHYIDSSTQKHVVYSDNKGVVGTVRYCSLSSHRGIQQTRRDDIEALGYVFIYFLRGRLPWQGLDIKDRAAHHKKIHDIKAATSLKTLCRKLPREILEFMKYSRAMEFDVVPDYNYLRGLFRTMMERHRLKPALDWGLPFVVCCLMSVCDNADSMLRRKNSDSHLYMPSASRSTHSSDRQSDSALTKLRSKRSRQTKPSSTGSPREHRERKHSKEALREPQQPQQPQQQQQQHEREREKDKTLARTASQTEQPAMFSDLTPARTTTTLPEQPSMFSDVNPLAGTPPSVAQLDRDKEKKARRFQMREIDASSRDREKDTRVESPVFSDGPRRTPTLERSGSPVWPGLSRWKPLPTKWQHGGSMQPIGSERLTAVAAELQVSVPQIDHSVPLLDSPVSPAPQLTLPRLPAKSALHVMLPNKLVPLASPTGKPKPSHLALLSSYDSGPGDGSKPIHQRIRSDQAVMMSHPALSRARSSSGGPPTTQSPRTVGLPHSEGTSPIASPLARAREQTRFFANAGTPTQGSPTQETFPGSFPWISSSTTPPPIQSPSPVVQTQSPVTSSANGTASVRLPEHGKFLKRMPSREQTDSGDAAKMTGVYAALMRSREAAKDKDKDGHTGVLPRIV